MRRKIKLSIVFVLVSVMAFSQNAISYNFDDGALNWSVKKGKAEVMEQGAYKYRALRMAPNTSIAFELPLVPASSYKLVAWMRTESGADNMSMQITNLGRNNISLTNAFATWTRFERTFNVSDNQTKGTLEFIFGNSQGNTFVWVDEISIQRIGDYKEMVYDGIPKAPVREVKTDLELEMQPNEKIAWMLDDKLGMFVHWGLYAGPAKGEWYMENSGVQPEEYRKLAYPESGEQYFDAKDFDATQWTDLAKRWAHGICA